MRGEDKPFDNAERLSFARIAHDRKHFALAARLLAEAMASDSKLADDPQAPHRYNAARAAALAATGYGKDEPRPDDAAKSKLRRQALDWLFADLTVPGQTTRRCIPGPRQTNRGRETDRLAEG